MLSLVSSIAADVPLASFDSAVPFSKFVELNDPVMGGQSSGTWSVDPAGKFGVFNGTVLDVPSLKAPGFIKAAADGQFPDASSAAEGDLVLMVRSTTPSYTGFRVSFASGATAAAYACAGGGSLPFSRGCFKAKFSVPAGDAFTAVRVPFHTFSDKWSPATGEQTTTCAQDKGVCPTADKLAKIQRVEVWAEGADGAVHLEIQSISAAPAKSVLFSAAEAVAASCSLHQVSGDTCGQSDLDCTYAPYAKEFEKGLEDGTCASLGYTVAKGACQSKSYPVVGSIKICEYTKPAAFAAALSVAADVPLASFDSAVPFSKFVELNDPVMGGQSSGTWSVDPAGKFGVFNGTVLDVPSLKAPGFIKAAADGQFPDASSAAEGDLVLMVRSTTPSYTGFRVSFASGATAAAYACAGGGSLPFSRGCFKAKFSVPAGDAFTAVRVPFHTFSDKWSPATGEQTTTCAQDKGVCPTADKLAKIQRVEVWAEGADGAVHLEIQSISAALPAAPRNVEAALVQQMRPPAPYDTCSGAVQPSLRYNVSTRTQPTVPVPVDAGESLAEAVCCDARAKPFAEPQFLFMAPDIALFDKLPASGAPTTFYDSVCGLPLFRAPVGRTFEEFKADTTEHGWPSFRPEEVISENIVTNKTSTFVTSKCGTHLGSYLPDAKGPRWCMDLSCVAGNPPAAPALVEAA